MTEGFKLGTAYLSIQADTSGLNGQIGHGLHGAQGQINGAGAQAAAGYKKKFLGGLKGIGAAVGVAVGVSFLKDSIQGWEDHQRVVRQSEAVIKSTGKAAGLSAKDFGDLADSIEKATGIDGDEILSGENVLATFTSVKGKVFKEATKTAVDLSVAFSMPLKNANVMLGKALQDPMKGISALNKVGVSFTAQQKKMIEHYTKTGQMVKAQGVILANVNTQVGGSAKAQETMGQKMMVVYHQIQDAVGSMLMPIIKALADVLTTYVLPAFAKFSDWASQHLGPVFKQMGAWIKSNLIPAIVALAKWFGGLITTLKPLVMSALPYLQKAWTGIVAGVKGVIVALKAVNGFFSKHTVLTRSLVVALSAALGVLVLYKTYTMAAAAATRIWAAMQLAWNAIMAANPIMIVVTALAALAAGLYYAYTHSQTFRDIVDKAFRAVASVATWLWNNVLSPVWTAIKVGITALVNVVKFQIGIWKTAFNVIASIVRWVWNNVLHPIWTAIATAFKILVGVIKVYVAIWRTIFRAIANVVQWAWSNVIKPVFSAIGSAGRAIGSGIKWAWNNVLSPVFGWIKAGIKTVWSIISKVGGFINSAFRGIGKVFKWVYDHSIGPVIDTIKSGIKWISDHAKDVADFFGVSTGVTVDSDAFARAKAKAAGGNKSSGKTIARASGGWVSGPGTATSDSVRALLSKGEFVVNAKAAGRNGALLEAINGGPGGSRKGGYAKGGKVTGNAGKIEQFLSSTFGLSKAQIAGFLGNFKVESGLNPKAYNPREGAIGLAQWELGRRTALQRYAKKKGLKETDLEAQLGYLAKELRGSSVLKKVKGMSNPAQIAALIDAEFERSSGSARGARMSAAKDFMAKLGSGYSAGSTGTAKGAKPKMDLSSKASQKLVANMEATTRKLLAAATKRKTAIEKIRALQEHLKNTLEAWNDMKTSIREAFTGTFDISSSGAGDGVSSVGRILATMKQSVADSKAFATTLTQLKKLGLNTSMLTQLAQAGPGSANAAALATASKSDVAQLNSMSAQLSAYGNQAGTLVANANYSKSIAQDRAALKTNTTTLQSLNRSVTSLSQKMKTLEKRGDEYHIEHVTLKIDDIKTLQEAEAFFAGLKSQSRAKRKKK